RIGTIRRLGGSIAIDRDRAHRALGHLGARLGRELTVEALAEGIIRIAVARMTSAIREISIQRGHDPRDFTLTAFARAGPMHALALAQEIGIPRVLVPRHPGNFSALGLLASQIKHDDVRTRVGPLRERLAVAGELFAEMERAARHQLELEGFQPARQKLLRSLDLRYTSQAFELNVALGEVGAAEPGLDAIEAAFHRQHLLTYGHANADAAVELVNARLTAYGLVPKPAGQRYPSITTSIDAALVERRPTARCGSASGYPSTPRFVARRSWRSSAPPPWCRRTGAAWSTSTGTCTSSGRRRRDRSDHSRGRPRGVRVDRARDARDARAHGVLVHPLRGRGLLLCPHGRPRSDRRHVEGTGSPASHRADRLVDEGGARQVRPRHPSRRRLPAQRAIHRRHAPERRRDDLSALRA